jgi:hypothetical protein
MMTDNDDKLKELLNGKHREDEFPVDHENWEKLSSVLKAERENKKRLVIYLSMLVGFLALTGIYLLNHTDKTDSPLSTLEKNSNAVFIYKNPKSSIKERNTKHDFPEKINSQLKERNTNTPKKEIDRVNATFANETADNNEVPLDQKSDRKKMQATAAGIKDDRPLSSNEKYENAEDAAGEPENVPNFQNSETQKGAGADYLTVKEKTDTNLVTNDSEVSLPTPAIESPDKAGTGNETVRLITKLDSVTPSENFKIDSIPQKAVTNVLALEVGSTYLLGWKNANETEANGFNPVLGLRYSTTITSKIGLSVGIQFTTVKNITATSHTSAITRIKFGEESDVTVISAREMYYLVAPLKLTYSIDSKNIISIGYNAAYLLDVKSTVKTYTQRPDYQSDPVVSTSMGYSTGFNAFDGQIAVGYRRRIYNELFINGEMFYGIKDIKDNVSYGSSEFERNYGFKLTLSCGLFKK